MLGRIALGRRAGARVWRLGGEPDAPWVASQGPRQAHVDGFDLHANLAVAGGDRRRLEPLCRYVVRPAAAQERLHVRADGRVVVTLKRVWADGTRELLFEPLDQIREGRWLISPRSWTAVSRKLPGERGGRGEGRCGSSGMVP